jgi:hypothetical protein
MHEPQPSDCHGYGFDPPVRIPFPCGHTVYARWVFLCNACAAAHPEVHGATLSVSMVWPDDDAEETAFVVHREASSHGPN